MSQKESDCKGDDHRVGFIALSSKWDLREPARKSVKLTIFFTMQRIIMSGSILGGCYVTVLVNIRRLAFIKNQKIQRITSPEQLSRIKTSKYYFLSSKRSSDTPIPYS